MVSIEMEWRVTAGHRLQKHRGLCKGIHGHNYVFGLELTGGYLIDGMLVDCDLLRTGLQTDVLEMWNHCLFLEVGDPLLEVVRAATAEARMKLGYGKVFPISRPPTAEVLATLFYDTCAPCCHPGSPLEGCQILSAWCQEDEGWKAKYKPDNV